MAEHLGAPAGMQRGDVAPKTANFAQGGSKNLVRIELKTLSRSHPAASRIVERVVRFDR